MTSGTPEPLPILAVEVIPYSRAEAVTGEAIATMMQGLVLDIRHPISLEIEGSGEIKRFIMRATTEAALLHAQNQLRLIYPQVGFRRLTQEDDPLCLRQSE